MLCWNRFFEKGGKQDWKEWSGLSESNRHLNLGKVPYYHYTKAAQPQHFYNTPTEHSQVLQRSLIQKSKQPESTPPQKSQRYET
jgi:hypothetical protein